MTVTAHVVRRHLEEALGFSVAETRRLGGQHGVDHYRLALADGTPAFAKVARSAVAAGAINPGFAAEAAGLRWLRSADAAPVPGVLAASGFVLVLEWVAEDG